MNFDQWIALEHSTRQICASARLIAHPDLYSKLNTLESVIAEMRHAAMTLCDRGTDDIAREQAAMRIHHLFTSV